MVVLTLSSKHKPQPGICPPEEQDSPMELDLQRSISRTLTAPQQQPQVEKQADIQKLLEKQRFGVSLTKVLVPSMLLPHKEISVKIDISTYQSPLLPQLFLL